MQNDDLQKKNTPAAADNTLAVATLEFVYIVIDQDMHGYEAVLGVYDSFENAMKCNAWENRDIVPNARGEGGSLFIYKEEINK